MGLGDEWTETTPGSVSKLNTSTVIYGTGAYLAGLDKSKHKLLVCTSTGSGFTLDHVYLCSTDGTTAIDISDINNHTHSSTAGDGGSFIDVILGGGYDVYDTGLLGFINLTADDSGMFRESETGTAAWSTQTDGTTGERYMQADTGGTTASTATCHMPINLQMNKSRNSWFVAKHKIGTATSIAIKCGYGMEDLAAADSNTRKYGAELCTTVNNNWFAASANGTTRSSSDTGTVMTTNKRGITALCYPGTPKMDLYVETASVYTKTSNIPTTSAANEPSRAALFRYTIKNNTGASRLFNFYGARLTYVVDDDSGITT